jgi:hypothetical protein
MLYVPAGVPGATVTRPVVGLSVGTGPPLIATAGVVTVTVVVSAVTATLFRMSLVNTPIPVTPPVEPLMLGKVSGANVKLPAKTLTVTVVETQLVGFSRSQIS